MNIDTINSKDTTFNENISSLLRIAGAGIQNPLYQVIKYRKEMIWATMAILRFFDVFIGDSFELERD